MTKSKACIPLGRVNPIEAGEELLGELQELLNPIPGLRIQYDPPELAITMDSILTITAEEPHLQMLEKLARTYLRL